MSNCQSKKIIWTADAIAKYLGVSRNKFYNLVKRGCPAIVIDGVWCAHSDNLELWFQRGTGKATSNVPEDAE